MAIVTCLHTVRVPLGHAVGTPAEQILAYREVPITQLCRGLALQHALRGPGWQVVHVASGTVVSPCYPTKAEARAVQGQLLALDGIDWRWSRDRLQRLTPVLQQRIQEVLAMEGLGEVQ